MKPSRHLLNHFWIERNKLTIIHTCKTNSLLGFSTSGKIDFEVPMHVCGYDLTVLDASNILFGDFLNCYCVWTLWKSLPVQSFDK